MTIGAIPSPDAPESAWIEYYSQFTNDELRAVFDLTRPLLMSGRFPVWRRALHSVAKGKGLERVSQLGQPIGEDLPQAIKDKVVALGEFFTQKEPPAPTRQEVTGFGDVPPQGEEQRIAFAAETIGRTAAEADTEFFKAQAKNMREEHDKAVGRTRGAIGRVENENHKEALEGRLTGLNSDFNQLALTTPTEAEAQGERLDAYRKLRNDLADLEITAASGVPFTSAKEQAKQQAAAYSTALSNTQYATFYARADAARDPMERARYEGQVIGAVEESLRQAFGENPSAEARKQALGIVRTQFSGTTDPNVADKIINSAFTGSAGAPPTDVAPSGGTRYVDPVARGEKVTSPTQDDFEPRPRTLGDSRVSVDGPMGPQPQNGDDIAIRLDGLLYTTYAGVANKSITPEEGKLLAKALFDFTMMVMDPTTDLSGIGADQFLQALAPAVRFMDPMEIVRMVGDATSLVQEEKDRRTEAGRWSKGMAVDAKERFRQSNWNLFGALEGIEERKAQRQQQDFSMISGLPGWGAFGGAKVRAQLAERAGAPFEPPGVRPDKLPPLPTHDTSAARRKAYEFAGLGSPDAPISEADYIKQWTQ